MQNHYHILLSELVENGIPRFLMKVNVGYAKYFNERYERSGTLFQGRTKKILVDNNAHFLYMLHYVHLNPLDYLTGAEKWRERDEGAVKDAKKALEYLNGYRWSSYLDYCGKKNFPSILTKDLFEDAQGEYQKTLEEHLGDSEIVLSFNSPLE